MTFSQFLKEQKFRLSLTNEGMASDIGVTTPAFLKWKNGRDGKISIPYPKNRKKVIKYFVEDKKVISENDLIDILINS